MDLAAQLAQITDQTSFIAFVRALCADRLHPTTHDEWVNDTIEDYLEAAAAWAEATPIQLPATPDRAACWQMFATFLYCGKIYE